MNTVRRNEVSYTSFGEFMRVQRIRHHEVMGDLEKVLDAKLPFLSAVENGKKNIPAEWRTKIIEHYNLSETEQAELDEVIEESKVQFKISAVGAGTNQRKAALSFARSFDKMDDDTAIKILELLSKKGADDK